MIKSYIKIAWRNLWKHKFHSMINMVGLAAGLIFVLLIYAYIWQEKEVNASLRNVENQYLISSEYKKPGYGIPLTTLGPLPKALKEEYPHLVANYYRIDGISCIVSHGDIVYEENAAVGDSTLLEMFGFDLVEGSTSGVLNDPFSVVITEAVAIKFFGTNRALNKTLQIRSFSGEVHDFKVTGVLKETSQNSVISLTKDMQNTIFLPTASADYFGRSIDNWNNVYIAGFVELQAGVTPDMLDRPIETLLRQHADPELASNLTPVLKPLKTYYLDDNFGAVRKMLLTLSIIAGFIMLMAVVNFINISISKATGRLKEIGVRKLMGSKRSQLVLQLGTESLVIVIISGVLGLMLYPILAPLFAKVLGKSMPSLFRLPFLVFFNYGFGVVVTGILAGIYPALRLTSVRTVNSIKGKFFGNEKSLVRKALLSFQFMVAMVVLIAAIVISNQVSLFFGKDIGYNKEHLITAQVPRDWSEEGLQHIQALRSALSEIPEVESVSLSYDVPGAPGSGTQNIFKQGDLSNGVNVQTIMSDEYFAEAYGLELLAGDFFTPTKGLISDVPKVVVSNKVVKSLGFNDPQSAVGQSISMNDGAFNVQIVGVTNDFHFHSMHEALTPVMWWNVKFTNQYRYFTVRLKAGSIGSSLAAVESKWKALMPQAPFEFTFMDSTLEKMYQSELQLRRAALLATVLTSIIVFLGIIGLVSLSIQQKVKEIGIRKVLGASISGLTGLFVKDFIVVFFVAVFISSPIAYFLMRQWLNGFYLKIELNAFYFLGPVSLLGFVALMLITVQTIKVATNSPANSLRDE